MSTSPRTSRYLERGTELLLWTAAALCFGTLLFATISSLRARHEATVVLAGVQETSRPTSTAFVGSAEEHIATDHAGDVIGRLDIPQLGLAVPVTAGIETSSLLRGVGHIEGTAMPGGLGTLGLAGHRDTYFRPLRRIEAGMDVQVSDRSGTYHYEVDSTEIVLPEQVDVLAIRSRPELTLITCFPFDYVGAAPKRFIVHAHLISAAPDHKN